MISILSTLKKLVLLTSGIFIIISSYSQVSTNTCGGTAVSPAGSVDFTFGQVFTATASDSASTVIQGVQQPYEIYTMSIVDSSLKSTLTYFPNPTTDFLNLQIPNFSDKRLSYQLFNNQGKLISSSEITNESTIIDMTNLATETYYLNIVGPESKTSISFKILKIK